MWPNIAHARMHCIYLQAYIRLHNRAGTLASSDIKLVFPYEHMHYFIVLRIDD